MVKIIKRKIAVIRDKDNFIYKFPHILQDGQWHQISATMDDNEIIKHYVDGILMKRKPQAKNK